MLLLPNYYYQVKQFYLAWLEAQNWDCLTVVGIGQYYELFSLVSPAEMKGYSGPFGTGITLYGEALLLLLCLHLSFRSIVTVTDHGYA